MPAKQTPDAVTPEGDVITLKDFQDAADALAGDPDLPIDTFGMNLARLTGTSKYLHGYRGNGGGDAA